MRFYVRRNVGAACALLLLVAALILLSGCAGNSKSSNSNQNNPPAPPKVSIPDAPNAVTTTSGDGQIGLSWAPVSNATSYNVYWANTAGVTTSSGTKIGGLTTSPYAHTSLTNGTHYYYIVTAVNSAGESPASTEVSAMPQGSPAPPQVSVPTAPNALTATPGDGQVSLSWDPVSNATSYNIYWADAAGVNTSGGSKIGSLSTSPYAHTSLTNGMHYYYIVTAVNSAGESPASTEVSAMPLPAGAIAIPLTPNAATGGSLTYDTATTLTFNFDGQEVTSPGTAVVTPLQESQLGTPLPATSRPSSSRAMMKGQARSAVPIDAGCKFVAAFNITAAPGSITSFATPATLGGAVDANLGAGVTLNLATLQSSTWVAAATLVIGQDGSLAQNLPSVDVPGLLGPGQFVLCKPKSTNIISNLGIALIADDSNGSGQSANSVQVIHLYDAHGAPLATPTVSYLKYPSAYDLDGQALTPDGSQGILVDGGNTVRFFSKAQTGTPVASDYTLDVSQWGGDGDSIAIMPDGNSAVVSADDYHTLIFVTDILSGSAKVGGTIPVPSYRDSVVLSTDGKVLLARSYYGLTVFSVTGNDVNGFQQTVDLNSLGSYEVSDGRGGMAISPVDSTRAMVISVNDGKVHLLTGLPNKPVEAIPLDISSTASGYDLSVSITPDGKTAIVGTDHGLLMISGVDTGNLAIVPCPSGLAGCSNGLYSPAYKDEAGMDQSLGYVRTLGITLDGKYVAACDDNGQALLVIPIAKNTFGATVGLLNSGIAIPYNDQMLMH
jgi:hypothetical protein